VTAAPEIEEDLDARVASIAASLREVAKPDQRPDAPEPVRHEPAAPAPTQQERDTALNRTIELILNDGRREKQKLRRAKPPVEWNRPLFLVSGLLVAAGFVGAVAGLSVTHNEEAAKADPTVTVGLPAATDHADVAAASAAPDAPAIEQPAELPVVPPTTRRNSQRVRAAEKTAPPPEPQADAPPAPEPGGPASDPLAPQPAAEPMAAALPLPNAVIARTIERIGYKCGTVASTAADAAAPGVFTVTCSSGQSYQATPVHGRYRFRRSGGR
jgi:hypothetical protein